MKRIQVLLLAATLSAAFPRAGAAQSSPGEIHVFGGTSSAWATSNVEITDSALGGAVRADYLLAGPRWATFLLYGGVVLHGSDADACSRSLLSCEISTKAGVLGGKLRLLAPIPYVSPYFEVGAGVSLGAVRSSYGPRRGVPGEGVRSERGSPASFHVPFSLGIAFGSTGRYHLALNYYQHPGLDHAAGSLAFGFRVR